MSRTDQNDLRQKKIVFTPRPKDFLPEEVMETEEERILRKAQQKLDFQALESKRGIPPKSLKEIIKAEYDIWEKHFSYIKMRKDQCTRKINPTKKITREEIEYSFQKNVADRFDKVTVGKYTIYFSKDTLDMQRIDTKGRTNLDRMKQGLSPIGADGQPMNYHHLTHHDSATHGVNCDIVLLSDEIHTKCSGLFHFGKNTYASLPRKKVDRLLFDTKPFNKEIAEFYSSKSSL